MLYKNVILPLLFDVLKASPEEVSKKTIKWLYQQEKSNNLFQKQLIRNILSQLFTVESDCLKQELFGLNFPNPVGLAAGFDKDGLAAMMWQYLGFGFAEIGTVTYHSQPGNPPPRLFRLPKDRAALNRMGFNNLGSEAMAKLWEKRSKNELSIPIGINLGKSKITPLEEAAKDYLGSFQILCNYGDYFVINVSSPNTPGLRNLQAADQLALIFDALQQENQGKKPILVKIAPDLEKEAIAEILALINIYKLAGIIATNTTIDRSGLSTKILPETGNSLESESGGISGLPVRNKSTEIIRYVYQQTQGKLPIIGVGGIFNTEDAWEKITAGASIIQVYTGWTYQGPWMVKNILDGLLIKLEKAELKNIQQAIGINNN